MVAGINIHLADLCLQPVKLGVLRGMDDVDGKFQQLRILLESGAPG